MPSLALKLDSSAGIYRIRASQFYFFKILLKQTHSAFCKPEKKSIKQSVKSLQCNADTSFLALIFFSSSDVHRGTDPQWWKEASMDRGSIICGRKIGDGKRDQCGLFDSSGFFLLSVAWRFTAPNPQKALFSFI